jgi:lysophospholipase L1-like esterase
VIKKIILMLSGLVVGLFLFEVALRVTGFGAVTPQMNFGMHAKIALEQGYFLPDSKLFWKVRPDLNPQFEREAKIQNPDRPVPPQGNKKRVLILGDSCSRIAGNGLPYPAILEQDLGPDRWAVLNASVPGYTSYQGLEWLKSQLLAAHPDIVVVYFGWNEHWRTTGETDRQYAQSRTLAYPRLLTLMKGKHHTPPFRVSVPEYRDNLEGIVRLVRQKGGRVILIAGPYHFVPGVEAQYVKDKYLIPGDDVLSIHRAYLDVVRGFTGQDGVTVVEADKVFEQLGDYGLLMRQDGIHFTDSGHRAMAAILAATVATPSGAAPPLLVEAARKAAPQ